MAMELPEGLQKHVFDTIAGAFKSRDVLEAERPVHVPPYSDDRVLLQNWTTLVDRQGRLLAQLSVVPATKAELTGRMPGLVGLSPAWLEVEVQGKQMTWDLFVLGLVQTVAEHRKAIERVVAEQVVDADSIEQALAEAPVPTDTKDRSALMEALAKILTAHLEALVDIAYDLERQFGGTIDPDELL
jgi:hypothetical protein